MAHTVRIKRYHTRHAPATTSAIIVTSSHHDSRSHTEGAIVQQFGPGRDVSAHGIRSVVCSGGKVSDNDPPTSSTPCRAPHPTIPLEQLVGPTVLRNATGPCPHVKQICISDRIYGLVQSSVIPRRFILLVSLTPLIP
jgi:hypothetical protein